MSGAEVNTTAARVRAPASTQRWFCDHQVETLGFSPSTPVFASNKTTDMPHLCRRERPLINCCTFYFNRCKRKFNVILHIKRSESEATDMFL